MKRHKSLIIRYMALIMIMACGLAACSSPSSNTDTGNPGTDNPGTENTEPKKAFFISGWSAPPTTANAAANEQRYREVAEAGFNHIHSLVDFHNASQGENSPAVRALNAAGAAGIGYNVLDTGIRSLTPQLIANSVSLYKDKPAFYGHLVADEPGMKDFAKIGAHKTAYEERLPGKLHYVNLLPNFASQAQFYHGAAGGAYSGETITYENYVETFIATVKPQVLSYDNYPFRIGQGLRPRWLRNLEYMAGAASDAEIDLWVFIQSIGVPGTYRDPNYADIRWQVFTSLAYGARGIQYFCYWTPGDSSDESFTNGMVDKAGSKTGLYTYVKNINAEIRAFEEVFLNFDWKSTLVYAPVGFTAAAIKDTIDNLTDAKSEHSRIHEYSSQYPMLIGTFKDGDDNDGFLITNYDDSAINRDNPIFVTFKNAAKALVCINGKTEEKALAATANGGRLDLTLAPGQGAFVVPKN